MKLVTLNLEEAQRIKNANIVEIKRVGKRGQVKNVTLSTDGILLQPGENKIKEEDFLLIEKSPWFILLKERGDIVVDGIPAKQEPLKESKIQSNKKGKKSVSLEVGK